MKRSKLIIIANNQPLNNDLRLRRKMATAEKRAERQSARFPGLDLPGIQREVHRNILRSLLHLNGRYLDLLDLLNFLRNHQTMPEITSENVSEHYSLANTITLNGIYLYQYLSNEGYDPILVQNYENVDLMNLLEERPLAVCISSNFIFMDEIRKIAGRIKAMAPQVPVIAGGMLIKKVLDPGEGLSEPAVNYFTTFLGKVDAFVIEGQGEQTLVKLLRCLETRGDLAQVPNLAVFDEQGKLVFTRRQAENLHMDETVISWDRIPRVYLRNSLPVNTSRGCFYRCRFCTYHWFFPQVHYKSLEVLRRELLLIKELGFVRHVRFTDDNFTANRARLKRVLEMMIREDVGFSWSCFARASALNQEVVHLMRRAGCEFVDMGLESGSQAILDNMDKKLTREQSLRAVAMLNDAGIYSRGSFIVGYPGETPESFSETVDFINESRLPYYHPYLFYYSRSALVHEESSRFGLEGLGLAWRHHTMDAAEASRLLSEMASLIPGSFTDGLSYVEEIYKLLRGEGYSPEEIRRLFELKRELQLALQESEAGEMTEIQRQGILSEMEAMLRGPYSNRRGASSA